MRGPMVRGKRGGGRRKGEGDTAPVGSVTGQAAQVQLSCQVFVCVRLEFQWAQPNAGNITNIVPAPTNAERRKIRAGLFGAGPLVPPTAPLELPAELDVMPCLFNCQCVNIQWGPWPANQVNLTVTKDVDLLQLGGAKTFTVTFAIPARFRQGIGSCQ
jgi:hypothetical protein